MELRNSTVLVTDGKIGIRLGLVRQLTEQGANIMVTGRNANALTGTKTKFPKVQTFGNDVSNPHEIERLYEDITELFPALDLIINNAGM